MQAPMHWFTTLLDLLAVLFIFMLGALCLTPAGLVFHRQTSEKPRHPPQLSVDRPLSLSVRVAGEFFRQYFLRHGPRGAAPSIAPSAVGSTAPPRTSNRPPPLVRPTTLGHAWRTLLRSAASSTAAAELPAPVVSDLIRSHPLSGPTSSFQHLGDEFHGAISRPAVLAPSRGAALAGCWLQHWRGRIVAIIARRRCRPGDSASAPPIRCARPAGQSE